MTDDDPVSVVHHLRRWQATTIYAAVVATALLIMKLLGW